MGHQIKASALQQKKSTSSENGIQLCVPGNAIGDFGSWKCNWVKKAIT